MSHVATPAPISEIVLAYREHGWERCQELIGTSKTAMDKRLRRYWKNQAAEDEWHDRQLHLIGGFQDKIDLIKARIKRGYSVRPTSGEVNDDGSADGDDGSADGDDGDDGAERAFRALVKRKRGTAGTNGSEVPPGPDRSRQR